MRNKSVLTLAVVTLGVALLFGSGVPTQDKDKPPAKEKAKEKGYDVKVGKFPFTANSRASIVGEHEGFVKIVSDAEYGEILGVHIIGPQATELIAEAVTAMELEATVEDLMWTIHAHPTLAEAMLDASNSVYGLAINM
jgi:dihydrolipoamide dehydrogenase